MRTVEVERWLTPWPIRLSHRSHWRVSVVPLGACARLDCIWEVEGRRHTIQWWAMRALHGTMPFEQHYVHMLARDRLPVLRTLTVVVGRVGRRRVVLDGNHHLIAAVLVRLRKQPVVRYVGVVGAEGRRGGKP